MDRSQVLGPPLVILQYLVVDVHKLLHSAIVHHKYNSLCTSTTNIRLF